MLYRKMPLAQLALLLTLAASSGCGDATSRGAVSGTITLDGEPVPAGTISFLPADGGRQAIPAWTQILDGRYSIPASTGPSPGLTRVEIHSVRKTIREVVDNISDPANTQGSNHEMKEFIPRQYNIESTLTFEIRLGDNVADFDLKSR